MSLDGLTNPVERSGILPGMMNYRGQWSAGQYFRNDVVTSPSDGQLYMLATFTTQSSVDPALQTPPTPWLSFAGGAGPATNPMQWQGTWSNATTYNQGAVVQTTTDQKAYVLVVPSSLNQEPSANSPATWSVLDTLPGPAVTSGTISASVVGPGSYTIATNLTVGAGEVYYFSVPIVLNASVAAAAGTLEGFFGGTVPFSSQIYFKNPTPALGAPGSTIVSICGTVIRTGGSGALAGAFTCDPGFNSVTFGTPVVYRIG